MKKLFKMPDRFYFPMHMLGKVEAMSVRPVEIDRRIGVVTAFIDIEKDKATPDTISANLPDTEPEDDMDWLNGGMTPVGPVDKETFDKVLKLLSCI